MADDLVLHTYLGDIIKSEVQPDGSLMTFGVATGPKMDLDQQACDPAWLREAMPRWMQRGNIREQHRPDSAVGKAQQAFENDDSEWMVAGKIVDPLAITKTREGVYTGYSIGVKNAVVRSDARFPNGLICGGDIIEVSLVDQPAYQYSKIATAAEEVGFPVMKSLGSGRYQYAGAVIEDESTPEDTFTPRPFVVRPGITTPEEYHAMTTTKAAMSAQEINNLPDDAFAYIEPGGKKDSEGKTTPRSLRHFPIHDKAHADNAAARIAQGAKFGKEALPAVEAAQRKFGEDSADSKAVEPDVQKDGPSQQLPTLDGEEAKHNQPVQDALDALKTLINQELQDEDEQNWCDVKALACIAEQLVQWTQGEALANGQDSAMPGGMDAALPIADVVLMSMQLDPEERNKNLAALSKAIAPKETAMTEEEEALKAAKPEADDDADDAKDDDGKESDEKDDDSKDDEGEGDDAKKPFPGAAPPFKKKGDKAEKAVEPDVEKVGRTISAATAATLTSLAQTPGVPKDVASALMSLAGVKDEEGPTMDCDSDGEDAAGTPGVDGVTHMPVPSAIDLMSPVNPHAEGSGGPTVLDPATGDKAATLTLGNYIDARASDIAKSALEQFVTSDLFITKLAEAGQAKVAAVEATSVAKTVAADLTTKTTSLEDQMKAEVAELKKSVQEQIKRIEALPQAPRAMVTELPQGIHAVERDGELAKGAGEAAAEGELGELFLKAQQGDMHAQRAVRERLGGRNW